MAERFSKSSIARETWQKIKRLRDRHRFSAANGGSCQVDGKRTGTIVDYGIWIDAILFMNRHDLWKFIPNGEFDGISYGVGKTRVID